MTKGKLLEILKNFDDDVIVIIQKDAEGNGYSPLYNVAELNYTAENSWSGECDDIPSNYSEPCIVLVPTN